MSTDLEDREERLNEAIAAYYQAVEAGRPPERGAFLTRYAEFAEELEAFFADQEHFAELAEPLAPAAATPVDPGFAPTLAPGETAAPVCPRVGVRSFGDYELLEEIARGGMG